MNSRTKKLLCIIVGGVAFVIWRASATINKYLPSATQAVVAQPEASAEALVPIAPQEDFTAILKAETLMEKQPWGRDPFDPDSFQRRLPGPTEPARIVKPTNAPPAPAVAFSGVSKAGSRWLAAVNGAILTVGDAIQDKYRVVEITNSSITFAAESWAFTYPLGEKTPNVHPWTEKP